MCFFRRKKQKAPVEKEKKQNTDEVNKSEEKKRVVKNIYHVSQNKDENTEHYKEWRVRKEGSDKTIKFFKTQKEAIDYANSLNPDKNTSVKVHKVTGQIRKQ